jgi:hypothetical protein
MIKKIWLLACLGLFSSCGSKETSVQSSVVEKPVLQKGSIQLTHKRVKELFVVIFEKNFPAMEWKEIFDLTNVLSTNKKILRTIEGEDTDEASAIRSDLIKKNAEILTALGNKSIFMLSWSAQDENCKFSQKDVLLFTCKPRNPNNPLNGGLPTAIKPVEWLIPDPVKSDVKIPYLSILLGKEAKDSNPSSYGLELRLKEESVSDAESWFKGDVVPAKGSRFLKNDGSLVDHYFQFGYAEMTLGD